EASGRISADVARRPERSEARVHLHCPPLDPGDPGPSCGATVEDNRARMHAADGTVRDRIPRRSTPMTNDHDASRSRPAVSVLMPFLGDEREAARALDALCSIERGPDDEV